MVETSLSAPFRETNGTAGKPLELTDVQAEAIGRETGEPGWLVDTRRSALETYRRMELPDAADDAWRHDGLLRYPYADLTLEALAVAGRRKPAPAKWRKPARAMKISGRLAQEDAEAKHQTLDDDLGRAGVVFLPILQAAREYPDLVRPLLGSTVPAADGLFSALDATIFDAGVFLHVPKGVRIEKPLHSMLWSSGSGLRAGRLLVHLEEGAEAVLLHESVSPAKKAGAARIDVVELVVRSGASLHFYLSQQWGANIVRVAHQRAAIGRDGRLVWGEANLGASSAKTFSAVELEEEGASAQWTALHVLDGSQQADFSTFQHHAAPNTRSDYLGKCVVTDSARYYSAGMVRVEPQAAGTDGYQGSRILTLSDAAKAEAVPGLEILSDDVRCSHGVTIGELDPEEMFYLRSRGISVREARKVLVEGFLEDAMGRIPETDIRKRLRLAVLAKMETMEAVHTRNITNGPPRSRAEDQGVPA